MKVSQNGGSPKSSKSLDNLSIETAMVTTGKAAAKPPAKARLSTWQPG